YLVIDAFDKCEDEARSELCEDLQDLPENAYLLITSRDVPELEGQINSSGRLLIRADDNDIEMYLEGRIEQMNRSKRQTDTDPGLRLLVTTTIRDKAQGMFLLAQLHLDSLANSQTPNEVRKALEILPTTLLETYNEVMDRIASQNDNDAQSGRKVLSWISHAKRPLTVAEIQHAIKIEPTTTMLGEGDLISQDIIVSVCAGIVTVDKESNIIRLVHYTAQEYFLKHRSTHFPNAEREVADACLTYL
ncbi:hypothetical protein BKA61DRAFT_495796, partial [Leptodontidium sp. MPI-SDFR-AT-0119]